MRCQNHFADLSSVDGVCATCLRQRLFRIIEAQTQADLVKKLTKNDRRRSSEGSSPEVEFSRSDVSCRKFDNSSGRLQNGDVVSIQRFFSTPQVVYRKKKNKFSIVSNFFRSKSSDLVSDPNFDLKGTESCSASTSTSWISTIFPSKQKKKKKKSRMFTLTDPNASRVMQRPCRGMSPAGESENEFSNGNTPKTSPQLKETPQWKETPQRTVQLQCKRLYQARNLTGFAFCLSPLVRPSPNRNWNQTELSIAGDVRIPVKPHIGIASRYCSNRSKKLANCGKFQPNY